MKSHSKRVKMQLSLKKSENISSWKKSDDLHSFEVKIHFKKSKNCHLFLRSEMFSFFFKDGCIFTFLEWEWFHCKKLEWLSFFTQRSKAYGSLFILFFKRKFTLQRRVNDTSVVIHLAESFNRHVNHVHVARTFHFYKISMREGSCSYAPLYPKWSFAGA